MLNVNVDPSSWCSTHTTCYTSRTLAAAAEVGSLAEPAGTALVAEDICCQQKKIKKDKKVKDR